MTGVEIDFIVSDSLEALELYKNIFEVQTIEVSDLPKGENEVVFTIYGVRFHLLDENEAFGLKAPQPGTPLSMWFNVTVPDIQATYEKAMNAGCTEVQPVTELKDYGVSNATFTDPFGYHWMLHQVHTEVSHEERIRLWEERKSQREE